MLLTLLILALGDPQTAEAARHFGGLPISSFSTYLVDGKNAAEVAASLQTQRPKLADGTGAYAVTSWRMPTRWGSDGLGECDPATVRITVEFEVTLPVLARDASIALKEPELLKWHDYMDFLAAHEARRMARVMDGARALEQRMRAERDCTPLNSMLSDGVQAIGARARALDVEVAQEFAEKPWTRRGFP